MALDPAVVSAFEAEGFFRYAPSAGLEHARAALQSTENPFATDVGRLFHADAEDLAEGGILECLAELSPFLASQGVRVEVEREPDKVVQGTTRGEIRIAGRLKSLRLAETPSAPLVEARQDLQSSGYVVHFGSRALVIYGDIDEHSMADLWGAATVSTLGMVNELLINHDSAERAWAVSGGNDLFIMFAPPPLKALIDSLLPERERLHDGSAD